MSITPVTDSPFAYVPVPHEHVPAVMTYLAGLISGQPNAGAESVMAPQSSSVPASPEPPADDWTDEELKAFLESGTKTADIVGRMLAHLTAAGDSAAMSTTEVAKSLELGHSQVKALPTHITRTLRKNFPDKGSPLWQRWGPELSPPRTEELFYSVTPERAAQFARVTT